jgi:hypothetical protein
MSKDPKEQEQPLSAEAAAALRQGTERMTAATPSPAGEQAATAAAIAGGGRGPELPAESQLDEFMATMRAQFDSMKAELEALKQQQANALAATGGPLVSRYAQAVVDKANALVAQHPDCPPGHFAPLLKAAATLSEHAEALARDGGDPAKLEAAGAAVERFAARTHNRAWGKSIDWSALLVDVETAVDEGRKLTPAA